MFLTMAHVFRHAEYDDMVFVCGFCYGNGLAACTEYSPQFRNRRVQDSAVFAFPLNVQTNKMRMM